MGTIIIITSLIAVASLWIGNWTKFGRDNGILFTSIYVGLSIALTITLIILGSSIASIVWLVNVVLGTYTLTKMI